MENEYGKKSWWSQRTQLEKVLTVVCTLVTMVTIALLVSLIVVAVNNSNDDSDDSTTSVPDTTAVPGTTTTVGTTPTPDTTTTVTEPTAELCLTQACITEASTVLRSMNLQANPCDDFYEFACGTFLKETVIPDDKTQVTSFSVIENQLKEQLRVIITEPIQENEIEPFQNVKKLYQACFKTATIEQRGTTPVDNVLNGMGGWPVVLDEGLWNENDWSWQQSVAWSRSYGYSVSYFLSFSVSTDNKDTTKRIIRIDQASLGLAREYLIEGITEPFVAAYHNYQVDLAVMFGADRARAEQKMRDVLNFEFELARISLRREDRRDADKLYNPKTVAELQTTYQYNNHNWLDYFNSILPAESQLTADDVVIVGALTFFEQLGELLQNTPKETLANYVMWRQAVSSVSYLPSAFKQRQQEYNRLTTGSAVESPRWLECVEVALGYYPHAFGALYVRKHFKEEAKAIALEMVNNIKSEFKEILKEIDWMDDVTKEGANTKADTISEQIGFADELLDDAKIVEYYASWPATVDENLYYESIFSLSVASSNRNNKRLREPVDKKEWSSFVAPAIVNAFYSSLENSIKFPAGILQGAFFNAQRPQYMNYGGIGFVIGHEITHGFDDQGSQYDAEGNLKNWWETETRDAYLEKAQCIINQYGGYVEPLTNLNLNGINTQGENIADNGGIKESYRAYVRWSKENPEPQLPGLNYTPQQMFWVSAGQVWCSIYREEAMKNRVTTGVHSPGQFRVIGPMSNMKEFAEDFKCAVGTRMNPAAKCEVW